MACHDVCPKELPLLEVYAYLRRKMLLNKAPTFIQALRKKRDHYLKFMSFPLPIRRSFSTTNAVETVNGQLERMRRNNGGYFHSTDVLKLKRGITIDYLEQGKWRRPAATTRSA